MPLKPIVDYETLVQQGSCHILLIFNKIYVIGDHLRR